MVFLVRKRTTGHGKRAETVDVELARFTDEKEAAAFAAAEREGYGQAVSIYVVVCAN